MPWFKMMKLFITLLLFCSSAFALEVTHLPIEQLKYDESITTIEVTMTRDSDGKSEIASCTAFMAGDVILTAAHCFNWMIPIKDEIDITILRPINDGEHAMPICETLPQVGEAVMQIGYPHWSAGYQHRAYGKVLSVDKTSIITDSSGYRGESGGPLISVQGKCVYGVFSAIYIEHDERRVYSLFTPLKPYLKLIAKVARNKSHIKTALDILD
jgi:V8-like Glu-specific endopeptidase